MLRFSPPKHHARAVACRMPPVVLLVFFVLGASSDGAAALQSSDNSAGFSIKKFSPGAHGSGSSVGAESQNGEGPAKVIIDGRINANQTQGIFAVKPPNNRTYSTGRHLLQSKWTCTSCDSL